MNPASLVENYSFTGDLISFITCVVLLMVIHSAWSFSKDRKFQLLKRSLYFIMVGTFCNSWFGRLCLANTPNAFALYLLRGIYHSCFLCCLYIYLVYIKKMLDLDGKLVQGVTYFTRAFFIFCLIMDNLSFLTGLGLHRENGVWISHIYSFYNLYYIYAVFLMFVMLVFFESRAIQLVRSCLLFTEAMVLVLILYGAVCNNNTYTSYTYVMPILVVMMMLHSKPFDDKTGALGEESFESYINQQIRLKRTLDFMVIKLNLNVVGNLPAELGKVLNAFWVKTFKKASLFNLDHDTYILVIPSREGTRESIQDLVENVFPKYYSKFQLQYKVLGLYNVDFLRSSNDLRSILNYLFMTMPENSALLEDEKLEERIRLVRAVKENLVDIEMKSDLNDPRVLTYCQPIRNMNTGKFDTAEALMRMSIPEKEFVTPDMFIPLAEYYGHIHSLTRIMLNKVCKQVKELEEQGYEFNRISVNFAASEVREENFCDEVIEIIKSNGIDPSRIGIELTETQTDNDFKILSDKMEVLKVNGMTLYLDDVGTGYSNLDRVVKFDVDVVKFDRFLLLEAEKDPKVARMLTHLAQAFSDLNYKLLFEGVETEENEKLCLACGADYIQGFKYSRPIPIEKLTEFFEKK